MLIDHLTDVWAIEPKALEALVLAYRSNRLSAREERAYEVVDGVAVIEVRGSLFKRKSSWWQSYEQIRETMECAFEDYAVDSILLSIDSPGGLVSGCKELADWIYAQRGRKPMASFADGNMCSAAYYIGSATGRVYVTPSGCVGSVGVCALHVEYSGMLEEFGIGATWLHCGKYKVFGNGEEKLSDEARAYLQKGLDETYAQFLADVSRHRGNLTETAAKSWADGQVFSAPQAVENGLAEGIQTLEQTLLNLKQEVRGMNAAELRAKYPEAVQEIVTSVEADEAKKRENEVKAAKAEGIKEGREASMAVVAAVCGDAAAERVQPLVEAGLTVEQIQAVAGSLGVKAADGEDTDAVEQATRAQMLDAIKQSAPSGVAPGAAKNGTTDPKAAAVARMSEKPAAWQR